MTRYQRWLLKRIARRVVIQGHHKRRIIAFLDVLINAARAEFTEDNKPTLDEFLQECFKEALDKNKEMIQ